MINIVEIQKENEKVKELLDQNEIHFQEKMKIKVNILKTYIEKLFGWKFYSDGNIIKLENIKNKVELYISVENSKLSLINQEQILGILRAPHLQELPEITSYFTMF